MPRSLLLVLTLACGPKAPPPAPPAAQPVPPASSSTVVMPLPPATSAPNPPPVSAGNPPPPPPTDGADPLPPHMRPPTEPQLPSSTMITQPVAEGFVDGPSLFPVVEAQRPVFQACWEAAKADNPALQGEIVVKIDINPAGKVAQGAVVSEPRGELGLESCILRKVMTLSFPPPRNGGVGIVRYPFDFTP